MYRPSSDDAIVPQALHRFLPAIALVGALWWSADAHAFDYLEHSYFTDRACLETQRRAAKRIAAGQAPEWMTARYLALALVCPKRWDRPYCVDGYKQLEGGLNPLDEPPAQSGELSITLGDFAALPDHMSNYGPIRGLGRIGREGLTYETWLWLTEEADGAGGVIGDVAEDACETDGIDVPWTRVEQDIDRFLGRTEARGDLESVPEPLMSPVARAPVPKGPIDPAGAYSFDNPHYLDLVLRNHHHFGPQAYSSWLGFHAAAVSIDRRSCAEVIAFDDDQLEDMADDQPAYADIDWEELTDANKRKTACQMMRGAIRARLLRWAKSADPTLVSPVADVIEALSADDGQGFVLLDDVVVATTALVMEGTGLHFLQDGLAGGHMRTIRSKEGLGEVRYDHDTDNREGVSAIYQTRTGQYPFVAFGDSYMLGPAQVDQTPACQWPDFSPSATASEEISACLIQHQRGLLVAASTASLIDWMYGGTLYRAPERAVAQAPSSCGADDPMQHFVCRTLPAHPTMAAGEHPDSGTVVHRMHHGTIPVPPPVFDYESLSFNVGLEATGDASQLGLHVTLLQELDDRANWLTSHRAGLRSTIGDGEFNQFLLDYSYGFHWRWSARFLVDARTEVFMGLRGLNADVGYFAGFAPGLGLTALPEGWTKLPLELTLGYRLPMNFYTSHQGFFGDSFVGGHWIVFGLGLAFM